MPRKAGAKGRDPTRTLDVGNVAPTGDFRTATGQAYFTKLADLQRRHPLCRFAMPQSALRRQ
jgi:hypothetical protein